MKRFYSFTIILVVLSFSLKAQTFQVDTLLKNGSIHERINLVFLGDGYTAAEQTKYITDVTEIIGTLFATPPFKQYKNYFNVYAIKVISAQSGANHPKTSTDPDCNFEAAVVNNYFGSTFDLGGIHRLLYPGFPGLVATVLANNFPLYDQGFVIVNTPHYGGAGGAFATCSDHPLGRDVAIHEIGHSFAGLADEYWAGPQYATEKPNMTQETNPATVKWRNWMGVSDVGIYPHSGDATWKKPHMNCKMGVLNVPLCKVCAETFVERFHQLVKPVDKYSPGKLTVRFPDEDISDIQFALKLVEPDPSTLKITWENNNVKFAVQKDTVTLSLATLVTPAIIRATILDTTELTRNELHNFVHVQVIQWDVKRKSEVVTGIEIIPSEKEYEVQVYSNPVQTELNFRFKVSAPTDVSVVLLDPSGKSVRSLVNKAMQAGEYDFSFSKETLGLSSSVYMLNFSFDKTIVTRKIVVK